MRDFVMSVMLREMRGIADDLLAECAMRNTQKFAHELAHVELSVDHGMREYTPDYVFNIIKFAKICNDFA